MTAHRIATLRSGGRRGLIGGRHGCKRESYEKQQRLKLLRIIWRVTNREMAEMAEEADPTPEAEETSRPILVANDYNGLRQPQ